MTKSGYYPQAQPDPERLDPKLKPPRNLGRFSPVCEDLLDLGVVTVLRLGLQQSEPEIGEGGLVAPDEEQFVLAAGLDLNLLYRWLLSLVRPAQAPPLRRRASQDVAGRLFDRVGAQVRLGDEWVTVKLGAEPAPAGIGGKHDGRGARQRAQLPGDEEPGWIGGCHVDEYQVGVADDRGRDRRVAGPDVGDVHSLGAQQARSAAREIS